ncbi:hypothetical protein B0A55_10565 [Friedmanniomyces simplex]|uniref:SnoaL-like domain-containing protein n=1 Tax=Friedmanniomyces simplex TaxID=329884 RepID=A0A4U0WNZ7_9PEZI|nr:hypothetical protein B0A55_10565 [Friedmanniomyces simplex]
MADLLDNMKRTAKAVVDGYNKWDIDAIMAVRADNCIHHVLPKSLGREPRNNEDYRKYFASIMPLFKDFTIWSENEIYDVQAKKAALHMSSTATTPIGDYSNEYAIFFTFTEDGTKLTQMDEMVDSAYSGKFFGDLNAFVKEHGGDAESAWASAGTASQP